MRPLPFPPSVSYGSFQSTHPLRGATCCGRSAGARRTYFNPRTPCGVRPVGRSHQGGHGLFQSTHPLRGATVAAGDGLEQVGISIHAPLAGCDNEYELKMDAIKTFQSTHPLRGATTLVSPRSYSAHNFNPRTPCGVRPHSPRKGAFFYYFNPRTPCGVRHVPAGCCVTVAVISIHAPLAGCDLHKSVVEMIDSKFQSTHPLRGATAAVLEPTAAFGISIHAPLAGCDATVEAYDSATVISIHAPLAGCDAILRPPAAWRVISIHAPLAGCDTTVVYLLSKLFLFQSTHPLRGATVHFWQCVRIVKFQSTHPLRGATGCVFNRSHRGCISIHAPLAGCDRHYQAHRIPL